MSQRWTPGVRDRMRPILAGAFACFFLACGGRLATRPGEFEVTRQKVAMAKRELTATYVRPGTPRHPNRLVVFCTGDAGWMGVSGMVFEHLAQMGYTTAGYDAREILKPIRGAGERVGLSGTASRLDGLLLQARKDLGLPETTPLILVGYSRGAGGAILATLLRRLQPEIAGTIAIALTRESDYLRAPDPADRPPEIQVDEEERIQLYPAIALAGETPVAVIQSTGDKYVTAAEARKLLGPDTPTRRLYEVEAKNHGFSGGRDVLLRDLEDALQWIEKSAAGDAGSRPSP